MNQVVSAFCKKHQLTEDQFYGREQVPGSLYLNSLKSIPEGFNPTVGGNLDLRSLKSIPEGFNPIVGDSLYLNSLKSIPEGFNPKVGGWMDLSSLKSIPEGFNPKVGGDLDLRSLKSIPEGFNPIVGGWMDLRSLKSIPEGFNPTVGGSLFLYSLTSIPEGFNPIVGGWMDLSSLKSIPEGFNPIVGGWMDLSSLKSIPEGFNPTVGGDLYISDTTTRSTNKPSKIISWQNGKYIKVDGIFTEVISKRNNVWKVKKINSDKIMYLVTDGNDNYSHGDTLKDARDSLIYKISDRNTDQYKSLSLDSVLTKAEMIKCYRTITGACEAGTKMFVESQNKTKRKYSIKEIIELTKGQFGNEKFSDFFS